jgi:uncharacterized protein (TIGR03435 family)
MRIAIGLAIYAAAAAQTFDVASVKPSAHAVGKDYRPAIAITSGRFTAHNQSLQGLILAAYAIDRYQLSGGPRWIDEDEFDVDAKADGNPAPDQVRAMLRALLTERFALATHTETREMQQRYVLVVDKGGPKIQPAKEGDPRGRFHGTMREFANVLSVQLSIPSFSNMDPTKPSVASGPPVAVIDETGLIGEYDVRDWEQPELGADGFGKWQRVLQEKLGLRMVKKPGPAELLIVERAEKPRGND